MTKLRLPVDNRFATWSVSSKIAYGLGYFMLLAASVAILIATLRGTLCHVDYQIATNPNSHFRFRVWTSNFHEEILVHAMFLIHISALEWLCYWFCCRLQQSFIWGLCKHWDIIFGAVYTFICCVSTQKLADNLSLRFLRPGLFIRRNPGLRFPFRGNLCVEYWEYRHPYKEVEKPKWSIFLWTIGMTWQLEAALKRNNWKRVISVKHVWLHLVSQPFWHFKDFLKRFDHIGRPAFHRASTAVHCLTKREFNVSITFKAFSWKRFHCRLSSNSDGSES